jgi:hypothetical protein
MTGGGSIILESSRRVLGRAKAAGAERRRAVPTGPVGRKNIIGLWVSKIIIPEITYSRNRPDFCQNRYFNMVLRNAEFAGNYAVT